MSEFISQLSSRNVHSNVLSNNIGLFSHANFLDFAVMCVSRVPRSHSQLEIPREEDAQLASIAHWVPAVWSPVLWELLAH